MSGSSAEDLMKAYTPDGFIDADPINSRLLMTTYEMVLRKKLQTINQALQSQYTILLSREAGTLNTMVVELTETPGLSRSIDAPQMLISNKQALVSSSESGDKDASAATEKSVRKKLFIGNEENTSDKC